MYEEFGLRENFQLNQVKVEYALKMPFFFMEKFMEQVFSLGSCLE